MEFEYTLHFPEPLEDGSEQNCVESNFLPRAGDFIRYGQKFFKVFKVIHNVPDAKKRLSHAHVYVIEALSDS